MIDSISKAKKVHFIGVGGIGISAIAKMMICEGKIVVGSDKVVRIVNEELEKAGMRFILGQEKGNVENDTNLVIYSNAVQDDNPELADARERGFKVISYPEALGAVSKEKFTIAVSGTAGKTTVTAMIAKIMLDAGLDPTVIVGSLLLDQKSNFISGKSKYFLVEADEYKKAFHSLEPSILVINNITPDHLDFYKDLEDIQDAFNHAARKVPETGFIVCNTSDENILPAIRDVKAKIVNYRDFKFTEPKLKVPGDHNRENAAAASAVGHVLGISEDSIKKSLENFSGTWRRFEYKGKATNGALVYDDYAHNPEKVEAALSGAREMFPDKKIFAVFQPHLYSRTKQLFDKFSKAFGNADEVLLAPIYAAREAYDPSISSEHLAHAILENGKMAKAYTGNDELLADLIAKTGEGDVVVFIGAGDVYQLGEAFLKSVKGL